MNSNHLFLFLYIYVYTYCVCVCVCTCVISFLLTYVCLLFCFTAKDKFHTLNEIELSDDDLSGLDSISMDELV